MSSDTRNNAAGMDRTSSSAALNAKDKRSPDYDPALDASVADADLTIDQYLRRQSHRAKAAIMGAAGAMKSTAMNKARSAIPGVGGSNGNAAGGETSGPMNVVKKHPWVVVGGAAAAGLLGAFYFNPTRYGRLRAKLKKLEKRLAEQEEKLSDAPSHHGGGDSKAQTAAKSSILSSLGTLLVSQGLNVVKPILTAYLEPLMAGRGDPSHNGHSPDDPRPAYATEETGGPTQPPPGIDPSI